MKNNNERDEQIRKRRLVDNIKLTDVAKEFNISIERVRQICSKNLNEELEKEIIKFEKDIKTLSYKKLESVIEDLSTYDRTKNANHRRRILVKHLHDALGLSYLKIASLLRRDHTSIINLHHGR